MGLGGLLSSELTVREQQHTYLYASHIQPSIHPDTAIRYLIIMQVTSAGLLPQWTDSCWCLDANNKDTRARRCSILSLQCRCSFWDRTFQFLASLAGMQSTYIPSSPLAETTALWNTWKKYQMLWSGRWGNKYNLFSKQLFFQCCDTTSYFKWCFPIIFGTGWKFI